MRKKQLFNNGWQFTKQPIGTQLQTIIENNITWSAIEIPHDWLIYDTNNLYETGEGWYKKNFLISSIAHQVISLCFEGIYMDATVYVNGVVVGEWKYGYSSFEFDITKHLTVGDNEVIVRVVHQSPNSRWYSGAGIYRNVWLKTTALTHIVTDGIYIATKKNQDTWQVEVETEAVYEVETEAGCEIEIKHTIYDREGVEVAASVNIVMLNQKIASVLEAEANEGKIKADIQEITLHNPILWSIENPYLYTLKTELLIDEQVVDAESQNFGFRTLRFDSKEGFFLNEQYVKLRGACEHHDLGCLGAAMNKTALRRQLTMLQEMGLNAIRTSHNMPAVELMDLADQMGILIISEGFDMWERSKTDFDYSRFFKDWYKKDVDSWVRRDRNHPSIIMWSIGNEIYDTHADVRGLEVTKLLKAQVLLHDPKQNGYVTFGSNFMAWENTQICAKELPVVGYNYGEHLYDQHHEKYPDWVIYGSETASIVQSRSIYHFPASQSMLANDDEQCSSLGNCTTSWGAKSTMKCITDDRDAKFCLGQFIWTGFDYIGEPTPYFTKNSYFGQIDTAGFAKDSFFLYQSEWTDYKKKPMVHILPYWDFNEGQLIDIRIYSNAPRTELFLNEESLGSYEIDHEKGLQLSGQWQVPYRKGVIKAVAYDENNKIIAVDEQSSFGDATEIALQVDKTELKADGQDLIFVTIGATDAEERFVANANNRVEVEVTGAGRLVGLDNGNSTDYDQYKGTSKRLFGGKLLAVIAAKFIAGDIYVKVSSKGLASKELVLKAIPADYISGVSETLIENNKSQPMDEIPIRKINLINTGVNHFNESVTSTKVIAEICPTSATYEDIKWSVITSSGVETNIATLTPSGKETVITAKGDGIFRLRCSASNGSTRAEIISELEFEISGLGSASINPYEFVSGGLYQASNCELGNGNLRGVATLNYDESHVGYQGIDFGEYGSDEITIPIFHFENDPLPIEIWEGMPKEEGSRLVDVVAYQANSIWNTYQSNTFKLSRRLKGITTLCFVVKEKIHIKGFQFKKLEKAYEQLLATESNHIFGDKFSITSQAVEQIGNNVSLEYENMDFGETGLRKIVICGRSHIEINTIHIRFHCDNGDINQIVEFPYSEEYREQEFNLEKIVGKQKVNFVFLPGSKFDFKWFRFL